jgi:hypothetical protein
LRRAFGSPFDQQDLLVLGQEVDLRRGRRQPGRRRHRLDPITLDDFERLRIRSVTVPLRASASTTSPSTAVTAGGRAPVRSATVTSAADSG